MSAPRKIETQEYLHHMSCGCCTWSGTRLWVDGVECDQEFHSTEAALEYVLVELIGLEYQAREYDYYDGQSYE